MLKWTMSLTQTKAKTNIFEDYFLDNDRDQDKLVRGPFNPVRFPAEVIPLFHSKEHFVS